MIDNLTIEKVKSAASIVDVIGDFYELRKNGKDYTCLCPFHEDRHLGSFKVSPTKNCYTCFSCGEHGKPLDFLMKHEHLSFIDAIRWLGKKYGIEVEGADKFNVRTSTPRPATPPLQTLVLPIEMALGKMDTKDNTLCQWLRTGINWDGAQRARVENVLRAYMVGHSIQGHTIFWQCDDKAQLRTGKMMMYKPDGHRDRETKGNNNWIHSMLERAGHPAYNTDTHEMKQCLFGLHLTDLYPNATVNIVESEKTALICAIAYGSHIMSIWMACGGKAMLSRDMLMPLIQRKRHIVLYPDKDAQESWAEAARIINYDRLKINNDVIDTYWKPEDGDKADIADILLRIISERKKKFKTVGDVIQEWPQTEKLIKDFDLSIV